MGISCWILDSVFCILTTEISRKIFDREISGLTAPVAQLDRVSASEAEGCGFDPRQAHAF